MLKLIIIRGPLGVGKTTVSRILAQKIDAEYISLDSILDDNNLVAPDADGIPLESFLSANEIIFGIASGSEKSFIIDGCFYYLQQIEDLKEKFADNIAIFTLIADVEECIERDSKREKVYGEDAARYVHMITTKIRVGHEIETEGLSPQETALKIMEML